MHLLPFFLSLMIALFLVSFYLFSFLCFLVSLSNVAAVICIFFFTHNLHSPFFHLSFIFFLFVKKQNLQVNLVLEDAIEYTPDPNDKSKVIKTELNTEILLNGNQIAILVPGGTGPPEDSLAAQSG